MRNQRGFTLVELIAGMAVLAIILAAVFSVLSSSARAQLFGVSQERSHTVARQVMQAVSDELRYSTNQARTGGGSGLTYSRVNPADGTSYSGSIALAGGNVTITRGAVAQTLGDGLVTAQNFAVGMSSKQYTYTVTVSSQSGGVGATTTLATAVWTGAVLQ